MRASFQAANRPEHSAGKLSFGSAITDLARFLMPFFGLVMLLLDSRNSLTQKATWIASGTCRKRIFTGQFMFIYCLKKKKKKHQILSRMWSTFLPLLVVVFLSWNTNKHGQYVIHSLTCSFLMIIHGTCRREKSLTIAASFPCHRNLQFVTPRVVCRLAFFPLLIGSYSLFVCLFLFCFVLFCFFSMEE